MTKMKNTIKRIKLYQSEERIREVKDKSFEIIKSEENKEKKNERK